MGDLIGGFIALFCGLWALYFLCMAIAGFRHEKEKKELRALARQHPQHIVELQRVIADKDRQWNAQWSEPWEKKKSSENPPAKKKKGGGMGKLVVMALCAIYVICPIDFIPDVLPVLGWGDDVVAGLIGLRAMFK